MLDRKTAITIAGAGSIGCYVGGCLALAGSKVTLLGRPRIVEKVAAHGIRIAGLDGSERRLQRGAVETFSDPGRALARAGLVIVTVKSGQTAEMADLVSAFARSDTVVLSLQNGVDNPAIIRSRLRPSQKSVAGMVPFNVVQASSEDGPPLFRRTTDGHILVEAGLQGLTDTLDVDGMRTQLTTHMEAVLWGKLVLNLNNALNALSGLPLAEQLADRRWRALLAAQITEALAAMKIEGIQPAAIGRLKPSLLPTVLRLPNPVFRVLARRMLAVDPQARSSMWDDLEMRRRTEIEQFQGAVVRLAGRSGRDAPVSSLVMDLIRQAEEAGEGSPHLQPEDVTP